MTPTPGWLQEKLFERRIVFVTGRLDEALAGQAAAQIMTLDACGDAPIDVVLGSADGTLEAAVKVGIRSEEGPPAIAERADLVVDGVGEFTSVLEALADA